ncbi:hypothetical protein BV20DRAFT_968127 [Pilatotrama ljubarskyi]|nr:hypothetical protein BV20DRAFT_968127 [Pilatotrama ljubarskyi]
MAALRLNEDILLHIMRFASRRTLCMFISTCRLFHRAGAQYLLEGTVTLDNEQQLDSFICFMKADTSHRVGFLRTLSIKIHLYMAPRSLSPSTSHALVLLFLRLARDGVLCNLMLYSAEELLSSQPLLPLAIAMLTTLKSLTLYNAGVRARLLLKNLQSQLTYADLWLIPRDRSPAEGPGLDADPGNDPFVLLHRSHDSLRQLITTCAEKYTSHTPAIPVYTHLRALTLRMTHLDEPYIGHYARACPNLEELTACDLDCEHLDGDATDVDDPLMDARESNKDDQEELGTWPSLRLFKGTYATLFSLGILCPISWIKLNEEDGEFYPSLLLEPLNDARPTHLDLQFSEAHWLHSGEFRSVFDQRGLQRLKSLTLHVTADEEERHRLNITAALDAVITDIIAYLPSLTSFEFCLDCSYLREDLGEPPSLVSLALEAVDAKAFAERINVAASGRLTSISVQLMGPGGHADDAVHIGPRPKHFDLAYQEAYPLMSDEDERKAWSGVRRLI